MEVAERAVPAAYLYFYSIPSSNQVTLSQFAQVAHKWGLPPEWVRFGHFARTAAFKRACNAVAVAEQATFHLAEKPKERWRRQQLRKRVHWRMVIAADQTPVGRVEFHVVDNVVRGEAASRATQPRLERILDALNRRLDQCSRWQTRYFLDRAKASLGSVQLSPGGVGWVPAKHEARLKALSGFMRDIGCQFGVVPVYPDAATDAAVDLAHARPVSSGSNHGGAS